MKVSPPRLFLHLFRWYCHPRLRDHIEGDLIEVYHMRLKKSGKTTADLKFIMDVLLLFRPGIIKPTEGYRNLNHYGMFKSYFKTGWRNLLRNKGYTFINIGGLALGMTVAILIGLWVYDELSFNKYHSKYDHLARVYRNQLHRSGEIICNPVLPAGVGTLLKTEYAGHFRKVVMVRQRLEEFVLTSGENKFTQRGYFIQPDGLELFSIKMLQGTRRGLDDLKSIVLSQSLAKKIFGDRDPINQTISIDSKWEVSVTGIYEDLPRNSEFSQGTWFAPLDLLFEGTSGLNVWNNYNMNVYVEMADGETTEHLTGIIKDAMLPHVDAETVKSHPTLFLLPMSDWHLFAQFKDGVRVTSDRLKFLWFFGLIGVFVLLLACINFMNLSTARSEKRAKEVGIRKSIGSFRIQLVYQFFCESLLVAGLSFIIAILLTNLSLPGFNNISDKSMVIPWNEPLFWLGGLAFTLLTGILAGSYPAIYLSSFNPVNVLKGTFKIGRFASLPRKVLVVFQFTISIMLIAATVIVYQQIQFAKNRPAGYSREGLVSIHSRSPEFKGKYEPLRNGLLNTGVVEEMAEANYSIISTLGWNGGFSWRGKEKEMTDPTFNINRVTFGYGKTIGWNFKAGRDFSREFSTDKSGMVINETTMKLMGFENPVGETVMLDREDIHAQYTIIGVIQDMVKGSPFEPADPCMYFITENDEEWIYIRIKPGISPHEALPKMEAAFSSVIKTAPFDYRFADEDYDAKFRAEERIGVLASLFSALAILISCSGLFGLASFVAEQRTKEIGIRKVMGASILALWQMLSREFVMLVFISCIIAIPTAWYFLSEWLMGYEYHTEISWWVFLFTCIGAMSITLLTVSLQAVRAAMMNPVRSLRSE